MHKYLAQRAQTDSPLAALVRAGTVHTAAEILMQPWLWRETARVVIEQQTALAEFLGGVNHVVLTGAGSSAYAGAALAPLFRVAWGIAAEAVPTTDLVIEAESFRFDERALLISLARSGDSPESCGAVDRVLAKFPQVRHLILTCNSQGALARKYRDRANAFVLLLPEAANERGFMMTASQTSLVVAGQVVSSVKLGQAEYHAGYLEKMAQEAERILDSAAMAAEVAAMAPERVCLLAPPALLPIAREGALKILEATAGRVATLAETFLGVRHGPLTFINSKTAVLYFASSDAGRGRYEQDLARVVAAKNLGAVAVALGPQWPGEGSGSTLHLDHHLDYGRQFPNHYRAPLDALFPQMLALFLCLRLGLRPDAPSEAGVIHRVVQGVTLYDIHAPYYVEIVDMFHYSDEDNYLVGPFPTREQAVEYARRRVWDSVEEQRAPEITPEKLREMWFMFGEDAIVIGADPRYSGSHDLDHFIANPATAEQRDWTSIADRAGASVKKASIE